MLNLKSEIPVIRDTVYTGLFITGNSNSIQTIVHTMRSKQSAMLLSSTRLDYLETTLKGTLKRLGDLEAENERLKNKYRKLDKDIAHLFSVTSGQTKLQQVAGLLFQAHLKHCDLDIHEDTLLHEYKQEYQGLHKQTLTGDKVDTPRRRLSRLDRENDAAFQDDEASGAMNNEPDLDHVLRGVGWEVSDTH